MQISITSIWESKENSINLKASRSMSNLLKTKQANKKAYRLQCAGTAI